MLQTIYSIIPSVSGTEASVIPIAINQNATFRTEFMLIDSSSASMDITDWTFTGSIATAQQPLTPITQFTASADYISSSVTILLSPVQTNQLNQTLYVYDVIATNTGSLPSEVYRIVQGKAKVNLGVTPSTVD